MRDSESRVATLGASPTRRFCISLLLFLKEGFQGSGIPTFSRESLCTFDCIFNTMRIDKPINDHVVVASIVE